LAKLKVCPKLATWKYLRNTKRTKEEEKGSRSLQTFYNSTLSLGLGKI